MRIRKELKSDVVLKKGPHGWEAWQTNKLIAKVHGFDEDAKEEVMKHIPGYENVIESGVKGMNTNSINRLIEKETGLRKSQKIIDYTRDSGSGNIAYRLNRVERWRNGDFHVAKYYQNTYDVIFDNVDARTKSADVIAALENAGCTNIIDNSQRGFIKFDIPVGEKIMNGYEGMNTKKKAWLIKVSIDNHTYDDGVMICDEETVKKYCKDKTAESEMENYDSDLDDIDWTVYSYSYQPIELVEKPIMNGYERNADSVNKIFSATESRSEGDTWTDSKGNTWMYREGVPDEKLDYDVNENVPDREKYHAYKMFVTKYNPANKRTWKEKGKLYPLYINAKNYYEIGPWYKCGYGASQVLIDEFTHEPLYDKNGKMKVKTYEKGLAFRPGGHAGGLPLMRHRGRKDLPHNGDNDFDYFHSQEVFAEIEFSGHYDYTDISKQRQANSENPNDPYEAGFTDINDLNTNGMGYYRFKTNTNASDDEAWFIASAFRIVRVISDNEMRKIIGDYNTEHGTNFKPQMRGLPNGKKGDMFNADFTQFGIENFFRRRNK